MACVAIVGTDPALAEALAACASRDGAQALRIGPDPGPDGPTVANPLREDAVAAASAAAGPLAGLVCATAEAGPDAATPGWPRSVAASRGIASVAPVGLKHGRPRVASGGAIVLTAAPGHADDAAASAARGLLLGLARGASGGFAARAIRVNHDASGGAGSATDRAEAAAFLLPDAAGFVTGANLGRGRQEEP